MSERCQSGLGCCQRPRRRPRRSAAGDRRVGSPGLTALVSGGLSELVAGRGRYADDATMQAGKGLLTCAVMAVSERCGALEVTGDTHPWPVGHDVEGSTTSRFLAVPLEWT